MHNLIKLFSLYFVFSCFLVHAGLVEPCHPDQVKEELIRLRLDPDIETNGQLLANVEDIYGVQMVERLSADHPLLHHKPTAHFDASTLQWITEAIWNKSSRVSSYLMVMFEHDEEKIKEQYMQLAYWKMFVLSEKSSFFFSSEIIEKRFFNFAKENIGNLIKEWEPHYSDNKVNVYSQAFLNAYFTDTKPTVGDFSSAEMNNPVIIVFGHNQRANQDTLTMGQQRLKRKEIIAKLKSYHIPNGSTIDLETCFGGCSQVKYDMPLAELKAAFLTGELTTVTEQTKKTYLGKFVIEMYKSMPLFTGSIRSYIGEVVLIPFQRVLKRDGTQMMLDMAVQIAGNDEQNHGVEYVKKEEARLELSREHLAILH